MPGWASGLGLGAFVVGLVAVRLPIALVIVQGLFAVTTLVLTPLTALDIAGS